MREALGVVAVFCAISGFSCVGGGGAGYDLDGDSFPDSEDCAPEDPNIHPGADDMFDCTPAQHADPESDCEWVDSNCDGVDGILKDDDLDGYSALQDCDDEDDEIHPGAAELCDGVDNDCDCDWANIDACAEGDQGVDEDFPDLDGDGYANCGDQAEEDYTDDCDDSDPQVNPGMEEVCDGVDTNCVSSDKPELPDDTSEPDEDGDGFFDCPGLGDLQRDCDDSDPTVGAQASDLDCDGSLSGEDCNDKDSQNFPGNTEVCDGFDNDCDCPDAGWQNSCEHGAEGVDEGFDQDGDGYRSTSCPDGSDCDDNDPLVYSDAPELCDGKSNDCGGSKEELSPPADETDLDNDGYVECHPWVGEDSSILGGGDCDPAEDVVHPGQLLFFSSERPNDPSLDYNCDGVEEPQWAMLGTGPVNCTDCNGALVVGYSAGWYGGLSGNTITSQPDCGTAEYWAPVISPACAVTCDAGTTWSGTDPQAAPSEWVLQTQACR